MAASLLLHDELEGMKPSFRAAIFVASPVPFSHCKNVGIDARRYFGIDDEQQPSEYGRPTVIPPHLITDPAYLRNPTQLESQVCHKDKQYFYQMFHTSTDSVRITVPTGHIFGSGDKWFHHSKDLASLCQSDRSTIFQHSGGHEVPNIYAEEIADVIETVFSAMKLNTIY